MTDAERVLLTEEERRRFIAYLENEVSTSKALISQMETTKIAEFVVKKFRSELLAAEIVLRRLQSYDEQTIRG